MAGIMNYSQEGINAASSMRDQVNYKWSDSWKEFAANYALQQQANANEVEMWKMQQDYNTPAAQMQRFKEAGLNPNLIYSQGNAGNASSAPGVHSFTAKNTDTSQRLEKISAVNSTIQNAVTSVNGLLSTLQGFEDLKQKQVETTLSQLKAGMISRQFDGPGIDKYDKFYSRTPLIGVGLSDADAIPKSYFETNPFVWSFADPTGYRNYMQDLYQTDQRSFLKDKQKAFRYWQNVDSENYEKYGQFERAFDFDNSNNLHKIMQYNQQFLNSLSPTMRTILNVVSQISPILFQGVNTFGNNRKSYNYYKN